MADNERVSVSADEKRIDYVKYPSVTERYYTPKYKLDASGSAEDHCILTHSNKICVITIASSHPIVKEDKIVVSVNYNVDSASNRLENKVSGKRKRGAQILKPDSILCIVTCDDGSKYSICSCIRGSLIEVNENLQTNPTLLNKKPSSDGYVAIVLPKKKEFHQEINKLFSQEQYHKIMKDKREQKVTN